MRKLCICLGVVLIVSFAVIGYAVNTSSVEKMKAVTVIISNEGIEGTTRGTGILLDSTHVLTCQHLSATFEDSLWIFTYPLGRVVIGHPEANLASADLSIIVLESSVPVSHVPVFQTHVDDGDTVTIIGNVLGKMKWFVSKGVISGRESFYLLTDALVNPGNSGGPWFNEKGEIVALTDWRTGPSEAHHYPGFSGGVGADKIVQFLKAYKERNDLSQMLKSLLAGN